MLRLLLADEVGWFLLHLLEYVEMTAIVYVIASGAFEMVAEVLGLAILLIGLSIGTRLHLLLVGRSIFSFVLYLVE